jgi:hypothetical protein
VQYVLLVLVNPVGDFHRSGLNPVAGAHLRTSMTTAGFERLHVPPHWRSATLDACAAIVAENHDRSAPLGTGNIKVF